MATKITRVVRKVCLIFFPPVAGQILHKSCMRVTSRMILEISHPSFCPILPLIDKNNRQTQLVLVLECKWPTQCRWTRLIVTLTGTRVVDIAQGVQVKYQAVRTLNTFLCQIFETFFIGCTHSKHTRNHG
jgi:hypothetical protein